LNSSQEKWREIAVKNPSQLGCLWALTANPLENRTLLEVSMNLLLEIQTDEQKRIQESMEDEIFLGVVTKMSYEAMSLLRENYNEKTIAEVQKFVREIDVGIRNKVNGNNFSIPSSLPSRTTQSFTQPIPPPVPTSSAQRMPPPVPTSSNQQTPPPIPTIHTKQELDAFNQKYRIKSNESYVRTQLEFRLIQAGPEVTVKADSGEEYDYDIDVAIFLPKRPCYKGDEGLARLLVMFFSNEETAWEVAALLNRTKDTPMSTSGERSPLMRFKLTRDDYLGSEVQVVDTVHYSHELETELMIELPYGPGSCFFGFSDQGLAHEVASIINALESKRIEELF